ncbi:MAG: hypothetical protein KDE56_20485 [Anaerolineales bacterium]|nr:hypothetical protein [Anaerolineales bacterium]
MTNLLLLIMTTAVFIKLIINPKELLSTVLAFLILGIVATLLLLLLG